MRLLITGAWQDALEYIKEIEGMGHEVRFLQQEKDELPCEAEWVEGVICNGLFIYHSISQFVNLKWIQLTSAGYDRVPIEYVEEKGIVIHNAKGVYSIPMAEFAIAGVLSLYKGINQFYIKQKEHRWEKNRSLRELSGQTVFIIGCGSVGTECARRFKAFGCRVIGADITIRDDPNYKEIVPICCLDEKLCEADVVVLTLPLTKDTQGLINAKRLGLIKGVLVNIARGAIVEQTALEAWNGEAVIDVFEDEPLAPDSSLWDKDGFLITPHCSFVGNRNSIRLNEVILNRIKIIGV